MRKISEYEQTAIDFLKNHGAKMTISHIKENGYWKVSNMTGGWLYRVRIDRNVNGKNKSWSFQFSDSKHNYWTGKRPSKYDVLACIEKSEPYGDVWDFANEFGYTIDDRESYKKTERTYKAVCKEYRNVKRMFGDCIDELWEIQ